MQTVSDYSAINFVQCHDKALFWTVALLSLVCLPVSFIYNLPQAFVLPFGFLFLLLTLFNFRAVFFLMLFVMPFSMEYTFGSLGLDIPSEPMVILLCACTFIYLLQYSSLLNEKKFKHTITLILLFQLVWCCYATLFSSNIILSIKYILAKIWYIAAFFILPLLFIKNEKGIRKLFWCLFVPTFLTIIYVLIRHGMDGFTFDSITSSVHPVYRNHVNYAVFITMIFPFIPMALHWYDKNTFIYKLLLFSIPVFIAAIYFSYTRGAWLAFLAMGVYYFIVKYKLTKWVLIFSGIVVFVFSVYLLHNNTYLKYSPNFETTIYHEDLEDHLSSTLEMEDMSTVERFYRWIAAVHLFKKHPMTGVGPNNFVSHYKKYAVIAYETYISDNEEKSTVHNYFLLLLTEQGIPAVVIYIAFIVAILIYAESTYHSIQPVNQKYVMAFTLCVVVFLINNTLSDLVEANKVGSLFYISAAVLVNLAVLSSCNKATNISLQ